LYPPHIHLPFGAFNTSIAHVLGHNDIRRVNCVKPTPLSQTPVTLLLTRTLTLLLTRLFHKHLSLYCSLAHSLASSLASFTNTCHSIAHSHTHSQAPLYCSFAHSLASSTLLLTRKLTRTITADDAAQTGCLSVTNGSLDSLSGWQSSPGVYTVTNGARVHPPTQPHVLSHAWLSEGRQHCRE
jgi:hypothetical protein